MANAENGQKGCWKVNENGEAIYIDFDNEFETVKADHVYSHWNELPDLVLEEVFSYLNMREKYYASLVCKSWNRGFYLPYVWSKFLIEDDTLTRGKFNYYSGWQHVLDHMRTQVCLTRVGINFKELVFRPTHSFHNLHQFMTLMSRHIEQGRKENCCPEQKGVGGKIKSLKYIFPCNMAATDDPEDRIFGTGGQLLVSLKRLLNNLWLLRKLELVDLLLDSREAIYLLDEVCERCCLTLRSLILINATRMHCALLHVGVFLNLQILVISPQNLGDDVIELIGYTRLRNMYILQNRYTPEDIRYTPAPFAWKQCAKNNPKLRVHLRIETFKPVELLWQVSAPVASVIYDSPYIQCNSSSLLKAVELYSTYLEEYGHEGLPKYQQPKSFNDRADSLLVLMVRQCPFIRTLIVRERVSTATLLLIAHTAANLKRLYVRRNAILLKSDWPKNPEWSDDFFDWLRVAAKSYDSTENEISQILGYRWTMLSDKHFKNISVTAHTKYEF